MYTTYEGTAVRDIVSKLQDLTSLSWDERAVTSGTGGTLLKARSETSRGPVYYKLSSYDSFRGIFGHESVNELIASRLLHMLGISHVPYKLLHARVLIGGREHEAWLSMSRDYRMRGERKQQFDTFYDLNRAPEQSPLDFAYEQGWKTEVCQMMAFDYLIINRDRHGANFEVVFRNGGIEFAPLYDHGLSFVCTCTDDEGEASRFDPMWNGPCNNYLGSRFLEDNLSLIPQRIFELDASALQLDALLDGLDSIISQAHIRKIEEILTQRWRRLLDLGIISGEEL